MPATVRRHLRCFAFLLVTSVLVACGGDDGPDDGGGGGGGGGLDDFPEGASQLSAADRATVAARLGSLTTTLGADDPVAAAAVGVLAQAVAGEGWITGVDAEVTSSLRAGDARLQSLRATERWGVFVGDVVVVESNDPELTGDFIRGIVALRGTQIVVGLTAVPIALGQPLGGNFANANSRGVIFEGSTSGWGATAGFLQLSTAQEILSGCGGQIPVGVTCNNGRYNGAISIPTSAPLPFQGNTATGSRAFAFGAGVIRGYLIEVNCLLSTLC